MTTSRQSVSGVGQRVADHRIRTYTPCAVGGSGKRWDSFLRDNIRFLMDFPRSR